MAFEDDRIDIEAEERFLLGLHRTAISQEEFLARQKEEEEGWQKDAMELAKKESQNKYVEEFEQLEKAERIPIEGGVYKTLNLTDIRGRDVETVYVEEDVLVPDIYPDMQKILLMEAKVFIGEKEYRLKGNKDESIKILGEISLNTIYEPVPAADGKNICSISNKLPLRRDWILKDTLNSTAIVDVEVKEVNWDVINERKFRSKITLALSMVEYVEEEVVFFDGIEGEELEMKKELLSATEVKSRKCQKSDIYEEIQFKNDMLPPEKILAQDIEVILNHKQLIKEKIIINASIYCNALYETENGPRNFQEVIDISRFIPVELTEGKWNSKVYFNASKLNLTILQKNEEDGDNDKRNGLVLEGELETCVEIYGGVLEEVVTDFYHQEKELLYDEMCKSIRFVTGEGFGETSIREIININETNYNIEQALYALGRVTDLNTAAEIDKCVVKGNIKFDVLCLESEDKEFFLINQEIPFRLNVEMVGLTPSMEVDITCHLKNIWFDKINNKQVEINAGIVARGISFEENSYCVINNIGVVNDFSNYPGAPMVLYVTRAGDTIWDIAKKFRTSVANVMEINGLQSDEIYHGQKLLVVK